MTHTYNISGMTCGGCKASVEKELTALPEITSVSVNLEKAQATITMKSHISISKLQNSLSSKYKISAQNETNVFASSSPEASEDKSELKQLFPLFLIFGYIILAFVLMNYKAFDLAEFMPDFMGLFYIVFSFFKFLDLKGFTQSFKMYDPLAKAFPNYGWIYPFIELALGITFLTRYQIEISLIITLVVLGITTVGVTKALVRKSKIQCACLGTALKLPMTKATFIENAVMILMAVFMLVKIYVL